MKTKEELQAMSHEELAQLEAGFKDENPCKTELPSNRKPPSKEKSMDLIGYSSRISVNYTDEEMEDERDQLCMSLGLSRYC